MDKSSVVRQFSITNWGYIVADPSLLTMRLYQHGCLGTVYHFALAQHGLAMMVDGDFGETILARLHYPRR